HARRSARIGSRPGGPAGRAERRQRRRRSPVVGRDRGGEGARRVGRWRPSGRTPPRRPSPRARRGRASQVPGRLGALAGRPGGGRRRLQQRGAKLLPAGRHGLGRRRDGRQGRAGDFGRKRQRRGRQRRVHGRRRVRLMAAGFAGMASLPRGERGPTRLVLSRMARAAGAEVSLARAVPACTFGPGEVALAEAEDVSNALLLCGYVRDGAEVLTAPELLARLRRSGVRLLTRLSGEFALAAWTGSELVLARDRLGTRPLYVGALAGGEVVFATSIKPLLAAGVDAAVDRDAVVRSLVLGYVPAPQTVLARVRQLGPGEAWWLAPWPKTWRYYAPRERLDRRRSLAAAARRLDRTLTAAVERAVPPEGRVGAFLSGGLDSSLVLARLAERGTPVRAFTLHFGDHLAGELRYAQEVARHLEVPRHVLELDAEKFCAGIEPALD